MKTTMLFRRLASWQFAAALILAGSFASSVHAGPKPPIFNSVNNDSDILGVAHDTDTLLVNPWGLTTGTDGNLHVCDNGTGYAAIYGPGGAVLTGSGTLFKIPQAAVTSGTVGSPSGVDIDLYSIYSTTATNDFVITSGTVSMPAHYLYCTEDGAIEGSREKVDPTSAVIGSDQSTAGAGYTGIALSWATSGTSPVLHHQLYAANFAKGKIDVFSSSFGLVTLSSTSNFTDPNPPAISATGVGLSWSPFNIHRLDYKLGKDTVRRLLVAYALHSSVGNPMNDIPGAANGYLALYTPEGAFVRDLVLTSGTTPHAWDLDSPWGIAVSHTAISKLAAPIVILVGNHGDGVINAFSFDPKFPLLSGIHLGTLLNDEQLPLAFDGLWALHFGPKRISIKDYLEDPADLIEDRDNLYFSAGILAEKHGLVGKIILP